MEKFKGRIREKERHKENTHRMREILKVRVSGT